MPKDLQESRTWFMTRSRCRISGLKVSCPDVFISRYPKSNYLAEMAQLGENILLLKEYGYLSIEDLTDVLYHIEGYIDKNYDRSEGIVFVVDIKHLEGADSKARKRYIEYLGNSRIVTGMVFYNLSTLFKFSSKLTKRLHPQSDRLHTVDTYPQALDRALKLSPPKNVPSFTAAAGSFAHEAQCKKPFSARPLAETIVSEFKLTAFNVINRLNGVASRYYVDELLRHIQSIDWSAEGFVPPDSGIYRHPAFRKVIDAIGFIKTEIDTLLNQRAEAERKLREREAKYRQLVEHAKAGILEYDYATNRILNVNDYFLRITEYSRDEILSMDPLGMLTEESRNLFLRRLKRLMAGEKISQDIDYRLVTRSGRMKWVLFNTCIMYEKGVPQKANVVITDITKIRAQQQYPEAHFLSDDAPQSSNGTPS